MENNVLDYVNDYRNSKNLNSLVSAEPLAKIAREQSIEMQGKNKIDHDGFSRRVSEVRNYYPQPAVAENVGFNYGSPEPERSMVESWINSQGHRKNILGNYRYTGIGISKSTDGKIYFTQVFVK
jgi:uncharacterized protein YkwD